MEMTTINADFEHFAKETRLRKHIANYYGSFNQLSHKEQLNEFIEFNKTNNPKHLWNIVLSHKYYLFNYIISKYNTSLNCEMFDHIVEETLYRMYKFDLERSGNCLIGSYVINVFSSVAKKVYNNIINRQGMVMKQGRTKKGFNNEVKTTIINGDKPIGEDSDSATYFDMVNVKEEPKMDWNMFTEEEMYIINIIDSLGIRSDILTNIKEISGLNKKSVNNILNNIKHKILYSI